MNDEKEMPILVLLLETNIKYSLTLYLSLTLVSKIMDLQSVCRCKKVISK
jgi:hypothetical protein